MRSVIRVAREFWRMVSGSILPATSISRVVSTGAGGVRRRVKEGNMTAFYPIRGLVGQCIIPQNVPRSRELPYHVQKGHTVR
ncbi:hypothetical protein D3C87_2033840 [compost metagenome]